MYYPVRTIYLLVYLLQFYFTSAVEFPLAEFLSASFIDKTVNITFRYPEEFLKSIYLCSQHGRCCSCNNDCMETRSCCIDKLWNSSHPLPLQEYVEKFRGEAVKYKKQSCLPALSFSSQLSYEPSYFYMVDSCLPEASKNDVKLCLNDSSVSFEQRIPVYGEDGYVYKNSYCAKCNSIETYFIANITLSCVNRNPVFVQPPPPVPPGVQIPTATTTTLKPTNAEILKQFSGCNVILEKTTLLKGTLPRYCSSQHILTKNCHKSNQNNLCGMYKGVVGKYQNIHCYACNGGNAMEIPIPQDECIINLPSRPVFWSLTINFGGDTTQITAKGRNLDETVSPCGDGEIVSLFDGECKPFTCSPGFKPDGVSCVRIPEPIINTFTDDPGFQRCMAIKNMFLYVSMKSNDVNVSNFKTLFENDFNTTNKMFSLIYQGQNQTIYKRESIITQTSIDNITQKLQKRDLKTWNVVKEYILSTESNQIVTQLYGFDISRAFNGHKLCSNTQPISIFDGNFTNNCSFQTNNSTYDKTDITLWRSYRKDRVTEEMNYCTQFHLHSNCIMETFTGKYTLLPNTSIQVTAAENKTMIYKVDQYLPNSDGISICREQIVKKKKNRFPWFQTFIEVQEYVSVIGTSISIVFHIFFIITYLLFKEMQNKGGINVLVLVLALLFTDTLFLVIATADSTNKVLCALFGILLHWGLLIVAIWTIFIAGDIARHFAQSNVRATQTCRRLVCYIMTTMLVPSILIATSISLNATGTVSFGYGDNNICLITSFYPLLATYIVPAFLAYLFSFICLCYILRQLYLHNKGNKAILRNSNVNSIALSQISLKLVIVLGLTEVLGVVQIYGENLSESETIFNSVFSMTYNITRSLRGVMICLIYLANEKTFELYKRRFVSDKGIRSFELQSRETRMDILSKSAQSTPDISR